MKARLQTMHAKWAKVALAAALAIGLTMNGAFAQQEKPAQDQANQQEQAQEGDAAADAEGDEATERRDNRANRPDAQAANGAEQQSQQGWLGVLLRPTPENQRGVMIGGVYPTSPAAQSTLRRGDIIVSVNGESLEAPEQAADRIGQIQAGEEANLVVLRGQQEQEISVTMGQREQFLEEGRAADDMSQRRPTDPRFEVPEHFMMLEQHRRLAEQHQRIESALERLMSEVQALRQEVNELRGGQSQPNNNQ